MSRCLISLGANIGDARASVRAAIELLRQRLAAEDRVELSRLYQTPPIGGPAGQPPFINAVAAVWTQRSPWEMWHLIRSVEQELGRTRVRRWEARRIDLDILLYEQQLIWTGQLKIPHPRMCMRRFILLPAAEVAADWLDPVSQLTIGQLAARVRSGQGNMLLVGAAELPLTAALQQATGHATARWLTPEQLTSLGSPDIGQRWVSLGDVAALLPMWAAASQPLTLTTKLLFVWQPAVERAAWEDYYRQLAIQLRLVAPAAPTDCQPLPLIGPRYLLASSDPAWAVHELTAALDAMDCPVEPLEE